MSSTRRRYEIAAAVPVVAVFAGLYAWTVPAGDPAQSADPYLWFALPFAMLTVLWLSASWLLVHQWWQGTGVRLSTMDAPGQLLALTVSTLPEPRQRWGEAMLGELAQVHGRGARWRFALSCVRAALSLPLPSRRPVLAIAVGVAVAAVIAAHLVVGAALPELAFFAATFVAVVGVVVILAIARARRVRPPTPTATLLVVIAVSAAVAATAAFLVQHPTAAEGLPPARAAFLAVALAGCLWLAVAPPRRLGGSRVAPYLGIGAAVLYCLAVLASERANLGELVPLLVFFGPTLMFLVPGLIGAAMGRSFRAGVQAGLWAAIAVLPLSWALGLTEASHQYAVKGEWLFAGDVVNAGFIFGFNLLLFALTPTVGFPFAVVGATAGALNRRTASVPERAS